MSLCVVVGCASLFALAVELVDLIAKSQRWDAEE